MFRADDGRDLPPQGATADDLYEWRCRTEENVYRVSAENFTVALARAISKKVDYHKVKDDTLLKQAEGGGA